VVQDKQVAEGKVQLIAHSRYVDRFERRDGDWRIAHRVVVLDSARTDPLTPWQGTSPITSMTFGRRDATDPVFHL
jgi:SnoaL-like domain